MRNFPIKQVYTIEPKDAEKYAYKYVNTIYSKYPIATANIDRDVLFVGRAKNRLEFLHELAQKLGKAGLSYRFFIFGVNKEKQIDDADITYNQYIPYDQVLKYVEKSKYILELLQEGQTGITFRCYECFLYNRVLVTNNKKIPIEFKNMNTIEFEEIEDLILKLKQYNTHEYEIDNRFSPTHFLSLIESEMD